MVSRAKKLVLNNVDLTSDDGERGESEKVWLAKKIVRFVIVDEAKEIIDRLAKLCPLP